MQKITEIKSFWIIKFMLPVLVVTGFHYSCFSQDLPFPAEKEFLLGRWYDSEFQLKQFLADYPVHPQRINKLWQLSQIYLQQNRFFEAETLLAELNLTVTGDWKVKVQYWLARSALDYDRLTEALTYLESISEIQSNLPEYRHAWVLRCYTLARLERWKAAEVVSREFLNAYPLSKYANYVSLVISESYFKLREFEKCITDVELLLPLLDDAEFIERAYLLLAESFAQQKRWKDAVIYYGKLESEYSNSVQIDWIRFRLAYSLMNDGQRIRAEEQINKISQSSLLLPFKKALQVEVWKYNGNLDKIIESDFQALSGQPLLSVYNLNHRIWAASKLNRWDTFKKDLLYLEKQPLLFMPLDSLWAQLGRLSFQSENYVLSGEAFQKAISFNKRLNKNAWAELYYNSGLSFYMANRFEQSNIFFNEFQSRFPSHTLAGEAFIYSLLNLKELGRFDSMLIRIKNDRDKYSKWYDIIDLLEAEVLFDTGEEQAGLELLDKKIRYAQDDSFRTKALYSAARLKMIYNRPDLALSNIRVMSRFYPQYFADKIEMMQILAEYQIQSFAYLSSRIKDYRTKFGTSGDQWLIPIEIHLIGKRGELTSDAVVRSVSLLEKIESVSYSLQIAQTYLDSTAKVNLFKDSRLQNKLLQFGETGIFLLNYAYQNKSVFGNSPNIKSLSQMFIGLSDLGNSNLQNKITYDMAENLFRQTSSSWIRDYFLSDLLKYRPDILKPLLDSKIIENEDIDRLKYNLSWMEYRQLSPNGIRFLLEFGVKPTQPWLGLHFFGGVSEYYSSRNDSSLSQFYLEEAIKTKKISSELYQLQLKALLGFASANDWETVDEKKEKLLIPIQPELQRMLDDMKLNFQFQSASVEDFGKISEEYLAKYGSDRKRTEELFVMKIQLLIKEKKKKEAKKIVKDYLKKFPKSGVSDELKKMVR